MSMACSTCSSPAFALNPMALLQIQICFQGTPLKEFITANLCFFLLQVTCFPVIFLKLDLNAILRKDVENLYILFRIK